MTYRKLIIKDVRCCFHMTASPSPSATRSRPRFVIAHKAVTRSFTLQQIGRNRLRSRWLAPVSNPAILLLGRSCFSRFSALTRHSDWFLKFWNISNGLKSSVYSWILAFIDSRIYGIWSLTVYRKFQYLLWIFRAQTGDYQWLWNFSNVSKMTWIPKFYTEFSENLISI